MSEIHVDRDEAPWIEGKMHFVGNMSFNMPDGTTGHVRLGGPNMEYRYTLERAWDSGEETVMFVMMNPSTATESVDDRTIKKCIKFAKTWGYRKLLVGNTFAYRCTDQARLTEVEDPIGPENDDWLVKMAQEADAVVFGFGTPKVPSLRARGPQVARMLQERAGIQPYALRVSGDGRPWHPLYIPDVTQPIEWNPA